MGSQGKIKYIISIICPKCNHETDVYSMAQDFCSMGIKAAINEPLLSFICESCKSQIVFDEDKKTGDVIITCANCQKKGIFMKGYYLSAQNGEQYIMSHSINFAVTGEKNQFGHQLLVIFPKSKYFCGNCKRITMFKMREKGL